MTTINNAIGYDVLDGPDDDPRRIRFAEACITLLNKQDLAGSCADIEDLSDQFGYIQIIKPSAGNNDVDGSQHIHEHINFGYDDVSPEEALDAYSIGYYGSFVERDANHEDDGAYSGNQYEGSNMFEAIVINPPKYVDAVRV